MIHRGPWPRLTEVFGSHLNNSRCASPDTCRTAPERPARARVVVASLQACSNPGRTFPLTETPLFSRTKIEKKVRLQKVRHRYLSLVNVDFISDLYLYILTFVCLTQYTWFLVCFEVFVFPCVIMSQKELPYICHAHQSTRGANMYFGQEVNCPSESDRYHMTWNDSYVRL